MATETEPYKNWHGVPFTYRADSRRVGLPQSAFGTLIDLYLLAHQDYKLRDYSWRWESRQHLAMYQVCDPADLDDLVRVGFMEEDEDGIRLIEDEFVYQTMYARAIPGEAEKKRAQRERAKAETPASANEDAIRKAVTSFATSRPRDVSALRGMTAERVRDLATQVIQKGRDVAKFEREAYDVPDGDLLVAKIHAELRRTAGRVPA